MRLTLPSGGPACGRPLKSNVRALMLIRTLLLLALATPVTVHSADRTETVSLQAAESPIEALHPGAQLESYATGDLDGDGVADLAYLVNFSSDHQYVLGVLRGQAGAPPIPWEQSKRFNPIQRAPEISIEKGSLFVSLFRNTLSDACSYQVQLQHRNGQFALIGREEHRYSPVWDDDPGQRIVTTISTNYLTRVRLTTVKQDAKVTTKREALPKQPLKVLAQFEGL